MDWGFAAVVCGAFLVCSLGVTWLSCRSELRQVPAELIRPRTPRAGKRILLEKIPFLWNRFSFLRKVSARNIFRYKKRMFMMIVGIAGCTALLLTAFGLNDSITGLADTQFSEISVYDAQVSFRAPMIGTSAFYSIVCYFLTFWPEYTTVSLDSMLLFQQKRGFF